ncbi:hypothetical protein BH10PSE12_BH10PSE12_18940 [soil metagenome]
MEINTLDTEAAAARIGFAPHTLENKRVYGGGPPYLKVGRLVRYRVSDIDAWLASKVVASTSQQVPA